MGFSRYAIEKKQVSTDRGVTWEDVTPSETQRGALVGTFRTLIECEDAACDLEKTEYTVIEGFMPNEICGDVFNSLPSGIAMTVQWTDGAICCNTWYAARPETTDRYGRVKTISIGERVCIQGTPTYCPSFNYYSTPVHGMEMSNFCFNPGISYCPDNVCACFQITEYMPWAEGKEKWKMIQAQHYTREHCSEPWVEDGEPYITGIGERWKYVDETFTYERWAHQIAKTFDEYGNVVEWETVGPLEIINMTDVQIDPNIDILNYVINDGVICYAGKSGNAERNGHFDIQISLQSLEALSGHLASYCSPELGTSDFYYTSVSGDTGYINYSYIRPHAGGGGTPIPLKTNEFIIYDTGGDRCTFSGLFCNIGAGYSSTYRKYVITYLGSILTGTRCGKIMNDYGETLMFPCRIHENLGQEDDYWNSSQIGYISRSVSSMKVMETLRLDDGQLVKEHPDWVNLSH